MTLLLALLLLGPAEAIAGKVVRHSDEYLERYPANRPPLPDPLPDDVEALVALVEAGHETPELFLALGDALRARGDGRLAYRAYHRAHRARPRDGGWGRILVARKDLVPPVPHERIRAEERAAEFWVRKLQAYERKRLAEGRDPRDRAPFYARYGRPESDVRAVMRARRLSGAVGLLGLFVGAVFLVSARWMPRRGAWLPLLVGLGCLSGPVLAGRTGLFYWGGAVALAGAAATALLGRSPRNPETHAGDAPAAP